MSIHNWKFLVFIVCTVVFTLKTNAQADTSRSINWDFIDAESSINNSQSPKKAGLYSALLPGLGQAYNKKYWKLPIVYGLGGFLGFKIYQSQRNYKALRNELFRRELSAEYNKIQFSENPDFAGINDGTIRTRKDIERESRDKFIVFSALFYGANILDAVVDAHLTTFKVGEAKELSLEPSFLPAGVYASGGLELKLRF